MENKQSSLVPEKLTRLHHNSGPYIDTKASLGYARFYMHTERIKEAVDAYSEILNSVNGDKPLAREISLERANAYIELGSFDEAIADLQSVVELSTSVSDEKRQELKFVFERLLAQIPLDKKPGGFVFDITPEEMTAEELEPEAAVLQETSHLRERELGRRALAPATQPT